MGTHTQRTWLATAFGIIVVACGAASTDPALESQSSQDQPRSFAESEQAAACEMDADCAEGFACRELQLGETVQRACVAAADAGSSDADAEAGKPSIVMGSCPPIVDGSHEPPPDACTKVLHVNVTEVLQNPRPKCYLDTTVDTTSPNATLYYACGDGGAGAALAKFGEQTFTGTASSGAVSMQHLSCYTLSAYGVTCRFDTKQLISGELASGTLQYAYSETMQLLSGPPQVTSCSQLFRTCSASGYVTAQ